MGPDVAVLDHAHFNITLDNKEVIHMSDKTKDEGGNGEGGSELTLADAEAMLAKLVPFMEKLAALKGETVTPPVDEEKDPPAATPAAAAVTPPADGAANADATAAQDAALAKANAIDSANKIKALESQVGELGKSLAALTADGSKIVIGELAARDALAAKIKPLVGVFDSARMNYAEVVAYACDKLELKPAKGSESAVLEGYLAGRTASVPLSTASDSKPSASLSAYLNGEEK